MELSKNYEKLFQKTLYDFNSVLSKSKAENKYALFHPIIGNDFKNNREIFLVGRATNNWGAQFNFGDSSEQVVDFSINYSLEDDEKCPMSWIIEAQKKRVYNYRKSPFWNSIKSIILNKISNSDERNWYSQLAWSNLFKIAQAQDGNANPTPDEKAAQENNSWELLKMELEELKPKTVLIISDISWSKSFLDFLNVDSANAKNNSSYVQLVSKYKQSKIIVTARPDSREKGVTQKKFVENLIKNI